MSHVRSSSQLASSCPLGSFSEPYDGLGLDSFSSRLCRWQRQPASMRPARVRIIALGNSVARWNKFGTSESFRQVLQASFPQLAFDVSTSAVEGGFAPSHQLYCGRSEWRDAHIALVHFAELATHDGGDAGRQLLEQLLAMPHLLVVVVKHCSLPQLEVLSDVASGDCSQPARAWNTARQTSPRVHERGRGRDHSGRRHHAGDSSIGLASRLLPYDNVTHAILRSTWFNRDKHAARMRLSAEGMAAATSYLREQVHFEHLDWELVRKLNATLVDSCSLLLSQLHGPPYAPGLPQAALCAHRKVPNGPAAAAAAAAAAPGRGGDEGGGYAGGSSVASAGTLAAPGATRAALERLASRMFPYNARSGLGDPLHPSAEYSRLQGCAAAHAIASHTYACARTEVDAGSQQTPRAQRSDRERVSALPLTPATTTPTRPTSSASAAATTQTAQPWCMRAGDAAFTRAIVANQGWRIASGGAGGMKRWLHATAVGAYLQLSLQLTSPTIALEYYKHDTLPLGTVRAALQWPSGNVTVWLDGRCSAADRCPRGQGFYHRALVAHFDSWPLPRRGASNAVGARTAARGIVTGSTEPEGGEALDSTPTMATLRLSIETRLDGRNGSAFSLATIVAEL